MNVISYAEYDLTSEALAIGERTKKGTFRPCLMTIPFTTISGALRERFSLDEIYAVGKLENSYLKNIDLHRSIHIYSPRGVFEDVAKVPLQTEFLTNVKAKIYIAIHNQDVMDLCSECKAFEITMGAFKSKGLGRSYLQFNRMIDAVEKKIGLLQSRIPEKYCACFGIEEVLKPNYGYLFEPNGIVSGKYIKAIFEGSLVKGADFIVEEVIKL